MKKEILGFIGAALLSIGVQAQISEAVKDSLQQKFTEFAKSYNCKGVGVAVHFKDGSVWEYAHGNYGTKALIPNLLFEAGSNTKTMVAVLTLLLEEEGKLSIDDSIGKYIVPTVNVNGQITIKQLLNHTSGVFSFTEHPDYYPNVNANWSYKLPVDSVFKYFVDTPKFAPGQGTRYSNTGYLLLGKIIEAVENQNLEKVMRSKLFDANELDDSHLAFYEEHNKTHLGVWFASGYDPEPSVSFLSSAWAAGAVICTPKDLSKWAYYLYSGNILSEKSFEKMNETIPFGNGERYGLGMIKREMGGHTYLGHGGQTLQTSTMDYSVDGDYSLVIMNLEDDKWGETMGMRARMLLMLEDYIPTVEVPIDTAEETASIHEANNGVQVSVYPVPATDVVTVELSNHAAFTYQLIDVTGQSIRHETSKAGKLELYKSELGTGTFWIRILDEKGQLIVKPIQFR